MKRKLYQSEIIYILEKLYNIPQLSIIYELDISNIDNNFILEEYYRSEEYGFNDRVSYHIYFKNEHILDINNVEVLYEDENIVSIENYFKQFFILNKPNFKDMFYYLIDNSKFNEQ